MALSQTGLAIGQVSRFISGILTSGLSRVHPAPVITVQRPQVETTGTQTSPRINLFLYEVEIDAALRNTALTPGSQPPLWMVLRYLLTTFDQNGESDTTDSHDLLGQGLQVLMGVGDALPALVGYTALSDNPEPLKLTFDQATPDLLSRLMQGPDDKYRCSAAFQVRPVLIAQPQLPAGMQLVGVNYQLGTRIGLAGVQNFVLPGKGPQIDGVQPPAVELGDTLTLLGDGLDAAGLTVNFGSAVLTPNMQNPQALSAVVSDIDPTIMSAGSVSVSVSQTLASGLSISSGLIGVSLLPTLSGMTIVSIAVSTSNPPNVYATIALTGKLLGSQRDYVEFALVRNGAVATLLDSPDPASIQADQSRLQFVMAETDAVPPGACFAILRVNGQQAKQAFTLNMVAP
ncbi:conserved hypothetical protein [Syntrophobacter sp. SbD1]|nr:conserved hypothetical protein [Syntrophobacter sp. SbD1]